MKKYKDFYEEATVHDAITVIQSALNKIRDGMMREQFEDLLPFERRLVFIEESMLAAGLDIMLMHLSFIQNA